MKDHAKDIIAQVPNDTVRIDVVCYNCSGSTGTMQALWPDVKAYLLEEMKGSIFGYRVTPVSTP
jgi:hypothetical protein